MKFSSLIDKKTMNRTQMTRIKRLACRQAGITTDLIIKIYNYLKIRL